MMNKADSAVRFYIEKKGLNEMKIAVTYENGLVFQHFGHSSQFKIYEVEANQVVSPQLSTRTAVDTERWPAF